MINDPSPKSSDSAPVELASLIAIAVGNTRTRVGSFAGSEKECLNPQSFDSSDATAIAQRVKEIAESLGERSAEHPTIVLAGVHPKHSDEIERAIRDAVPFPSYRFGRDFQIPIKHTLTEAGEMTVGQDRLLCALGAFDTLGQACVVIDVGTAVTVDFVDGTGVFHGGAILPGISMMLSSLHESTSSLPKVAYKKLDADSNEPAKQTDEAIVLGVTYAVRGAVRLLTERYAEHYQAYPQTIVTGGDLGVLEGDELIDTFVPDLQLQGIRIACAQLVQEADDEE
jgi:type III pantothenate kinase